jgi:hypothetical protein
MIAAAPALRSSPRTPLHITPDRRPAWRTASPTVAFGYLHGDSRGLGLWSAAGAPALVRRDSITRLAGDYLLDLLSNAPHDDLPLLRGVVRKGLIDPFRDRWIVSAEIRHIAGDSLLADRDYRSHVGLIKGDMMFFQLVAQLFRFPRERGHYSRVCARADKGRTA